MAPGIPLEAQAATPSTPPTAEEVQTVQKLGALVAKELVADLRGMGLPAVQAAGQAPAQVNDIVLHGYFTTVEEGSEAKRL